MIDLLEDTEAVGSSLRGSLAKIAAAVLPPVKRKKSSMEKEARGEVYESVRHVAHKPVKAVRSLVDSVDEALTKKACAAELLRLNAVFPCQAAVLLKQAEVSPERARRAMDRLSDMEGTKATGGQVARYAGIGGGGGAAIAALGNVIEGYAKQTKAPGLKGHLAALGRAAVRADKNPLVGDKIRSVASTAVKGALGAGVIPLARAGTDRGAERRLLKKYIQENAVNA